MQGKIMHTKEKTMKEYAESMKEFFTLWTDLTMSMIKNPMEVAARAWKTEHFEKLYETYSKNMSEMMERFYKTPGFATRSWDMLKSTKGFQNYFGEMLEMGLRNMSIPTAKDIDELSERLNYLEDRLDAIEQKVTESAATPEIKSKTKAAPAKSAAKSTSSKAKRAPAGSGSKS
jgi:hypothetical protein